MPPPRVPLLLPKLQAPSPHLHPPPNLHTQGSYLFYFKSRREAMRPQGVIPLEASKIETEPSGGGGGGSPGAPPAPPPAAALPPPPDTLTITLHAQHACTCEHTFYRLSAPSAEVAAAWTNALWQAAIPRADLVQALQSAGRLADVVRQYALAVGQCFPVADSAVLSTSGRARFSFLANVGVLAGWSVGGWVFFGGGGGASLMAG